MDTKLKNSKKIRSLLTVIMLLVVTFVNLCWFTSIAEHATNEYSEESVKQREVNTEVLQSLYQGALVMYYEQALQTSETTIEPIDLFVKIEQIEDESERDSIESNFGYVYSSMEQYFENYRYEVDYYASNGKISESNTAKNLAVVLDGENVAVEKLATTYQNLWIMEFDENGQLHISVVTSKDISEDMLVRSLKQVESEYCIAERIKNYTERDNPASIVNRVQNFTVIYGISTEQASNICLYENWYYMSDLYYHIENEASEEFLLSVMVLAVLAFVMNSPKIWKDISPNRKGRWFLFEPALLGVFMFGGWYQLYCDRVYQVSVRELDNILDVVGMWRFGEMLRYGDILLQTFLTLTIIYVIFAAFCPVFSLGVKEYIRQYSFIYQIFPQMKKHWGNFKEEVEHIDFSDKTRKTIIKVIVANFIILSVLTCLWVLGVLGLIIYSFALYFVIDNYYTKILTDYNKLLKATNRIAEGDLDTVITDDIGVFEPMKGELTKIRNGFKKAVDEEVKSQRMKTELITNVSHDLKTPLTAITTYVELLKKDDITEEERKSYVETLERKSLRLKVLIEDLFEVSKASSDNITLNLMNVDLVKLMKQVAVEHAEKYEAAGINLCWKVPDEKVELMLDSQKTYRIFENLFVNIQKYAMNGSRVYIDVEEKDNQVAVVMKNMSAAPLNVAPEELAERFVRGDASRNTEGSGLGLAIAKSFTEAQKGSFEIVVDGDLFKTTIVWLKKTA